MLACLAIACLATGSWQNEEQFGPLGVRNNSIPQRIMVGECEKAFYPPSFFLPTRFSPLHVILLYFERASTNDGTRQLLHLTSASLSSPPTWGRAQHATPHYVCFLTAAAVAAPTRAQYGTNSTLKVWLNQAETMPTSTVTVHATIVNTSEPEIAVLTRSVIQLSAVRSETERNSIAKHIYDALMTHIFKKVLPSHHTTLTVTRSTTSGVLHAYFLPAVHVVVWC